MVKLSESTVYIRTKCAVDQVKKLNLWGCDIDDISLCSQMENIEVLSLSLNKVESLEPLQHCIKLTELYLRKNNLQSLDELKYLQDLKNLRILWIDDNPCTMIGEYRAKVIKMLPQLVKLDDKNCSILDEENKSLDEPEMSVYNNPCKSTIVDTVMQPQMVQYGSAPSDEERHESRRDFTRSFDDQRMNLMTQSTYGTLPEENEWSDFSVDEDANTSMPSRMWTSMYETLPTESRRHTRSFDRSNYQRSTSAVAPRRRAISRTRSSSPARQLRVAKIMSAVSVLLDELDAEGLREVVEEAQNRMKKRR